MHMKGLQMTTAELNELIERYGQAIFGFCWHLCGNMSDAEELYQDTMLKIVEIKHRVEIKTGSDSDYLRAKNYCLAVALRLYKHRMGKLNNAPAMLPIEDFIDISSGENIEKDYMQKEEQTKLGEAILKLSFKKRIVIIMFYYGKMEIRDIAKTLHIPEGTVKSRLNSAKAEIKKIMEGQGYEGS